MYIACTSTTLSQHCSTYIISPALGYLDDLFGRNVACASASHMVCNGHCAAENGCLANSSYTNSGHICRRFDMYRNYMCPCILLVTFDKSRRLGDMNSRVFYSRATCTCMSLTGPWPTEACTRLHCTSGVDTAGPRMIRPTYLARQPKRLILLCQLECHLKVVSILMWCT